MIEKTGGSLRVTVPMVIANACALLEAGRSFLQAGDLSASGVLFDFSAVEEADSSALTLVFAWLRSAQEHHINLRVTYPPSSMLSLAELYGISDFLPLA